MSSELYIQTEQFMLFMHNASVHAYDHTQARQHMLAGIMPATAVQLVLGKCMLIAQCTQVHVCVLWNCWSLLLACFEHQSQELCE